VKAMWSGLRSVFTPPAQPAFKAYSANNLRKQQKTQKYF
jgi:hypothetical protein